MVSVSVSVSLSLSLSLSHFPGSSAVKNPPAMQETQFRFLGWEDHLEEGIATHSRLLAWRIPWTEEPGGLHTVQRAAKSQTQLNKSMHTHKVCLPAD